MELKKINPDKKEIDIKSGITVTISIPTVLVKKDISPPLDGLYILEKIS